MSETNLHGGPRKQAELELRRAIRKLSQIKRGPSDDTHGRKLDERDKYSQAIFRIGEDLVKDANENPALLTWLNEKIETYKHEKPGGVFSNYDSSILREKYDELGLFFMHSR